MDRTVNEALMGVKTREDAISTINSLYGIFETDLGKQFLLEILEDYRWNLLDWLPDDVLIQLAQKHIWAEWKGWD